MAARLGSSAGGASGEDILADTRCHLSSYKLPREICVVDQVPRAPNGKANYPTARELFLAGRREQSS